MSKEYINRSKIIKYIVISILFIGCFIYELMIFAQCPMDSDYANLVLEANDIIHGNILLKGWNLTGVSFLTTDVLFFCIGVALFGTTLKAYVFSISLMYILLLVAGMFLLPKKNSYWECLIYAAILVSPCYYLTTIVRAHTACVVWSLFAISLLENKIQFKIKIREILAFILVAFAVFGDEVSLVLILIPYLIANIIQLILIKENQWKNVLIIISGIILGYVANKLYYSLGNVNINSFLSNKIFISVYDIFDKFSLYIECLFGMFDANFFGKPVVAIATMGFFLKSLIILFGLYILVKDISRIIKCKELDIIQFTLELGVIFVSVVFILTDLSIDVNSARYFATTPVLMVIVIVRELSRYEIEKRKKNIITILLILCFLMEIIPIPKWNINRDEDVCNAIECLKDENVSGCYGDFWSGSIITVYSENKVRSRAIQIVESKASMYNWFCKNDWYDSETRAVIINNEGSIFGVSETNVKQAFGNPDKIRQAGKYCIYIYENDISKILQ